MIKPALPDAYVSGRRVLLTRPFPPSPAPDDHWAPDHLVLARQVLAYGGRLLVEQDENGLVLDAPLDGVAAVEQRYPAWARGSFARITPEGRLPGAPGVYALVDAGAPRYVGATDDLARTFGGNDGLGLITRRTSQRPDGQTLCRLNRHITTAAERGRTIDLYHLVTGSRPSMFRAFVGRRAEPPEDLAAAIAEDARGAWQLPR